MLCLIVEILMLINGIYALATGRFSWGAQLHLDGARARIAGLVLLAPLPLAFLAGIVMALLGEFGLLSESARSIVAIATESLLVLGALTGVLVWARAEQ